MTPRGKKERHIFLPPPHISKGTVWPDAGCLTLKVARVTISGVPGRYGKRAHPPKPRNKTRLNTAHLRSSAAAERSPTGLGHATQRPAPRLGSSLREGGDQGAAAPQGRVGRGLCRPLRHSAGAQRAGEPLVDTRQSRFSAGSLLQPLPQRPKRRLLGSLAFPLFGNGVSGVQAPSHFVNSD